MKNNNIQILRVLYPVWIVLGMFGIMYISTFIISESPSETAQNIKSNNFIFRLSILSSILTQLIYLAVAYIFYEFFITIDKRKAQLLLIFTIVGVAIALINSANSFAALFYASKDPERVVFFLSLREYGIIIASIFWGLWLLPLGCIILNTKFFPKFIAILLIIAGWGYVLNSLTKIVFPKASIFISITEIMTFDEVVFALWIIFIGIKNNTTQKT